MSRYPDEERHQLSPPPVADPYADPDANNAAPTPSSTFPGQEEHTGSSYTQNAANLWDNTPSLSATNVQQDDGYAGVGRDIEDRDHVGAPLLNQQVNTHEEENREEHNNIHYGPIPQRHPRRYTKINKISLYPGNFVIDAPVPSKLLDMCALKNEREFTHMRYTAATCDPDDFGEESFTLRQRLYGPPRRTELFIAMTMYDEDEQLFARTMHGVMQNIKHLCERKRSKTWGDGGWKRVVVCIVSDGRMNVNSRTLSMIETMGVYQDGAARNMVDKKPVTAHIYEYTAQISFTPSMKIEGADHGMMPCQIIFCLKEKTQNKINSHRWFFNAFGPILQPNICVLLDVGTCPGPTSIYHLWKAFDIQSNVGGACGKVVVARGTSTKLNPFVAAWNFHKLSSISDKPLKSVSGQSMAWSGAFSAYRYIALRDDRADEGPLRKYFLAEKMHRADEDISTAKTHLTKDQILRSGLVSKLGGPWTLQYVKSAHAETSVPDQAPELVVLGR